MKTGLLSCLTAAAVLAVGVASPARADSLELAFDRVLKEAKAAPAPKPVAVQTSSFVRPFVASAVPRIEGTGLEARVASLATHEQGRIGVAALDLASGRTVSILGDQPFPMASTSKIAIVATFLDGVDKGFYRLDEQFPIMVPLRSAKYSSVKAPVRAGPAFSARYLIERTIANSDNQATDALLAAVGGTQAVNRWVQQTGVKGFRLDRDIATLVRDDGQYDPARTVDLRDSATPLAMTQLLSGLYQGKWLSKASRDVLIGAMERCVTGKRRIPALLPEDAAVAHKTGTLSNTTSDVGIIHTPDGRAIAVAIYVTGQGGKPAREARIAAIARTIYDGYQVESSSLRRSASR